MINYRNMKKKELIALLDSIIDFNLTNHYTVSGCMFNVAPFNDRPFFSFATDPLGMTICTGICLQDVVIKSKEDYYGG